MPSPTAAFEAFVPPNDIAAEQSVLGACLIEKPAIDVVAGILKPADFYRENHVEILTAMMNLHGTGQPVDIVTLPAALGPDTLARIGGIGYIAALFDAVPTAANVAYYAGIVLDHATRRRAIAAALGLIAASRNTEAPLAEALGRTNMLLQDLQMGNQTGNRDRLGRLMTQLYSEAEERSTRPPGDGMLGLTTGLSDVDRMTSGLQPSDLIVIAARPSQGKTALVARMVVESCLKHSLPVLLFSLEMSKEQMATRIACMQAGIDGHKIRTGKMDDADWAALAEANTRLYAAPIDIDDTTNLTPMQAAAIIRKFRQETGSLGMVAFDYLQLMTADERCENKTQETTSIVRGLKNIAREFRVPVVALSQLSRAVESRASRRPQLSDLANSSGIEAESDLVMFLYNADIYARQEKAAPTPILPGHRDIAELIIAKHRNGPTGVVKIGFQPVYTRFVSMAEDDIDEQAAPPPRTPSKARAPSKSTPSRAVTPKPAGEALAGNGYTRPIQRGGGHSGERQPAGGVPPSGVENENAGNDGAGGYGTGYAAARDAMPRDNMPRDNMPRDDMHRDDMAAFDKMRGDPSPEGDEYDPFLD